MKFCFLFAHQLQTGMCVNKESVESFVYLEIGIWRGPQVNKQYPTPNGI